MDNVLDKIEKIEKVDGRKNNGGKRIGAGMPKGKLIKATVVKQIELAYIKERVSAAKDVLINAQLTLARGVNYLYKIEKDSKGRNKPPEQVTSQYEIEAYLAGEGDQDTYYYISTAKPDNNAIDSLLNRTVGKAPDTIRHEGTVGIYALVQQLEKDNATQRQVLEHKRQSKKTVLEEHGTAQ